MLSDHWFNPDIDVRKSGEWGWGSRSWRGGGVGIPIPLLSFICSVVNNGFQASVNSFCESNFTSVPLFSLCCSGFLAKSFFKSESVDPLSTSTLRALRVDVAPLMDDSSSFSPVFVWILHWTITLQPLGGIKRISCFHFQTLFDYLVIQVVILQYHLRH